MMQPKIITLKAKKLFEYFPSDVQGNQPYCLNTMHTYFFKRVIKQTSTFEECPLYHQFIYSEKFKEDGADTAKDDWLYDKLLIVDFEKIFDPVNPENETSVARQNNLLKKVEKLIEQGLDVKFEGKNVHFLPFDKSGNMSRKSRISFINEDYYEEMNVRLNLGIDFSQFEVPLSKYYAYRGLNLSTSRRVVSDKIEFTPETIIVMKNNMEDVMGPGGDRNIEVITAEEVEEDSDRGTKKWQLNQEQTMDLLKTETPFDGQGFITKDYSEYINDALDIKGASSYQIRLPFTKGMLHRVDVQGFLQDFDAEGMKNDRYDYIDAFDKPRDLKKAKIFLSESMFKCFYWLKEYCKNNGIDDPMRFYCDALNKYNHALYISGTNLPYGHSSYTHLSYQMLNTLDLTEEQFENVISIHKKFLEKPIDYIKKWDETELSNETESVEDASMISELPNWKKAVIKYPEFQNNSYIRRELKNTRKGLLTKLVMGKILVQGQTRYLCRDLMPMLYLLLGRDKEQLGKDYNIFLWQKTYLPVGDHKDKNILKDNHFGFNSDVAFFRSPHLSRNEQCVLQAFFVPEDETTIVEYRYNEKTKKFDVTREDYKRHVGYYDKYFGHLTGIAMVPRGSAVPLCLGGADFDGDLVNIVVNQDIAAAVRSGCYVDWMKRKLPYISIPSTKEKPTNVPNAVPYTHIFNTFSNRIGYLSNMSIAIGQYEYGKDSQGNQYNVDDSGVKCSDCTVLTGLEIDSAKNGRHPDLGALEKCNLKNANYIKFLNEYKRFKSNPKFVFDDLKFTDVEKQHPSKKCMQITSKQNSVSADFYYLEEEDPGTFINKLPILFREEYQNYKKRIKEETKKRINPFINKGDIPQKHKKNIVDFEKDCSEILRMFFFYKITFMGNLKEEKNKATRADANLSKYIIKKYDKENAEHLQNEVVPNLRAKLDRMIPQDVSVKSIMDNLNTYNWQFQDREVDKKDVLEKMIGNGFQTEMLSQEEKDFLFHFNLQGYKALWFLLDSMKETRLVPYDNMRDRVSESKEEYVSESVKEYDLSLDLYAKSYYEYNVTDIDEEIYQFCTRLLKDVMKQSDLEMKYKVAILYDITEGSKIADIGKMFWDVFSWEEIESSIVNEEVKGSC